MHSDSNCIPVRQQLQRFLRRDCRAVRRFLVAASGSAVRAPRLPRRAKIWRRAPHNFEIALSAGKKKRLLNHMACARSVKMPC